MTIHVGLAAHRLTLSQSPRLARAPRDYVASILISPAHPETDHYQFDDNPSYTARCGKSSSPSAREYARGRRARATVTFIYSACRERAHYSCELDQSYSPTRIHQCWTRNQFRRPETLFTNLSPLTLLWIVYLGHKGERLQIEYLPFGGDTSNQSRDMIHLVKIITPNLLSDAFHY